MITRRVLPLSLIALTVSCSDVADVDAQCFSLAAQPLRGEGLNGVGLNGVWGNGIETNDVYMQWPRGNGIGLNGSNLNGIQLNDVYLQSPRGSNDRLNNGVGLNGHDLDALDVDVSLDGARLVVRAGGQALASEKLAGLTLEGTTRSGDVIELFIARVQLDADDAQLAFYDLEVGGVPVCADGERGLFVSGTFDDTGRYLESDDDSVVSYACASGVIHKCVLWGYEPWSVGHEMHTTCTRLARADYCGDGVPWTQNGTLIDVYDVDGVQQPVSVEGLSFEAGWDADGAVCVDEPRYVISDVDGSQLLPACWSALPRCASFDEALDHGALIGNDSAHSVVDVCR